MVMKVGYGRVSTADQHLRMQEDALRQAGCDEIFTGRVEEPPKVLNLRTIYDYGVVLFRLLLLYNSSISSAD
jgi:hypothetical protein